MNHSAAAFRGVIPQALSLEFDSIFTFAHDSEISSHGPSFSYSELAARWSDVSADDILTLIGDYTVYFRSPTSFTSGEGPYTFFVVSGHIDLVIGSTTFHASEGDFITLRRPHTTCTFVRASTSLLLIGAYFVPPVFYCSYTDGFFCRSGYCYVRWLAPHFSFTDLYSIASIHGPLPRVRTLVDLLINKLPRGSTARFEMPLVRGQHFHLDGAGPLVSLSTLLSLPNMRIGSDTGLTADDVSTLARCTIRVDPTSDKMLTMLGFNTDQAKVDAVKLLYGDRSSRLRQAIDQTIADKMTKDLESQRPAFRAKVTISQQLIPDQERLLETAYPEFDITFKANRRQPHPIAAASRKLETLLILQQFNYAKNSVPSKGFQCCVVDVGGNWASHLLSKRKFIHSCCPILDAYDDLRLGVRRDMVNTFVVNKNDKEMVGMMNTYRDRRCRFYCQRRCQDCLVKAPHVMSIHSLYDISQENIANILVAHKSSVLAGTMLFLPEILLGTSGRIEHMGCEYTIDSKADTISFFFSGDASYNYVHRYSSYKKFFTSMAYTDSTKKFMFYTQLGVNRLGVQFFTIHRSCSPTVPPSTLAHRLFFESMIGQVVVKYYDFDVKATSTRIAMKPHTFLAPQQLYEKILLWAVRFPDSKFSVFETFNYACSVNNRQVHGGVSITTPAAVDPTTLMKLSHAVYLKAYVERYNMGKVDKNVIDSIKFDRALGDAGVIKKVGMILRGAWRSVLPEGKLSSIMSCWVANPDRFEVSLDNAVTVTPYCTYIQHCNFNDPEDEPYDFTVEHADEEIHADVAFNALARPAPLAKGDPSTGVAQASLEVGTAFEGDGSSDPKHGKSTVVGAIELPSCAQPTGYSPITVDGTIFCVWPDGENSRNKWRSLRRESHYCDSNELLYSTNLALIEDFAFSSLEVHDEGMDLFFVGELVDPTREVFTRMKGTTDLLVCTASPAQQRRQEVRILRGLGLRKGNTPTSYKRVQYDALEYKLPSLCLLECEDPLFKLKWKIPQLCKDLKPAHVRILSRTSKSHSSDIQPQHPTSPVGLKRFAVPFIKDFAALFSPAITKAIAAPQDECSEVSETDTVRSFSYSPLPTDDLEVAGPSPALTNDTTNVMVAPPLQMISRSPSNGPAPERIASAVPVGPLEGAEVSTSRPQSSEAIVPHTDPNGTCELVTRADMLDALVPPPSSEPTTTGETPSTPICSHSADVAIVQSSPTASHIATTNVTPPDTPGDSCDGASVSVSKCSELALVLSQAPSRPTPLLTSCNCSGHTRVEVPSDGSCFYWSIAHHCGFKSHSDVRLMLLNSTLDTPSARRAKVVALRIGEWADEDVFELTSAVFKVTLCVHEIAPSEALVCKVVGPGHTTKWCFAQSYTHLSPLTCETASAQLDGQVSTATAGPSSKPSSHQAAPRSPRPTTPSSPDASQAIVETVSPVKDVASQALVVAPSQPSRPPLSRNPALKTGAPFTVISPSLFSAMSPIQQRLWGDFYPAFVVSHDRLRPDFINAAIEVLEYWRIYTHRLSLQTSDFMSTFNPTNKHDMDALRLSAKGVGVFDMHAKRWIVSPPKGEAYSYGHNGRDIVKLPPRLFKRCARASDEDVSDSAQDDDDTATSTYEEFWTRWEGLGTSRFKYIYTDSDFSLLQETKLYNALSTTAYLEGLSKDLTFEFVNGVPGCGKTTYILNNHKRSVYKRGGKDNKLFCAEVGDLVLTNTREGAKDIRRRLQHLGVIAEKWQYRTLDSFLLNGYRTFNTVWVDEALMAHFGALLIAFSMARCTKAVLIGDRNQIPFIGRLSGIQLRFANAAKYLSVTTDLNVTWRCPVDVAAILSPLYSSGMKSCSGVKTSLEHKCISSLADVPKREGVKYLTFRQQEKRDLLTKGFNNVSTVHEFQGSQADVVYVVRTSRKSQDAIYNSEEHVVVALSRHRQKLIYFSPMVIDSLHRRISKKPAARDMQMATTEIDTPYPSLSTGWFGEREFLSVPHTPSAQIRMPVHPSLQVWYDSMLPFDSTEDMTGDTLQVHTTDIDFDVGRHETKVGKLVAVKDPRPTLQPLIRTGAAPIRPKSMRETVLAFAKRNANVPELSGVVDTVSIVKDIVGLFQDVYIAPQSRHLLRAFQEEPLLPSSIAVEDWLRTQTPETERQILGDGTALWDKALNEYSFMNKREVKPALDHSATVEYKPSQTIAFPGKDVNAIFSPIFREALERLKLVLKPWVLIFSGDSLDDFALKMSDALPPSLAHGLFSKEVDFSKYDKSQGMLHLRLEIEIFRLLGVHPNYLLYWYAAHYYTQVNDISCGFKAWLLYQRKSGDAATFLGNTIICMCIMCSLYDMSKTELALFAGDDSLVLGRKAYLEKNMEYEAAVLFNMESKFFSFGSLYFCSKFVLPVADRWVLMPDPLKLVFKLGRHDIVDWEHLNEYWTSLKDLLKPILDSSINESLNAAITDRYPSGNSDHTYVFGAIATLIEDRKAFFSLFSEPEGGIIRDPSRPKLDF